LAEHRHFGRAAAALGVSQPALTRSLKHIEDILGVSLFDREGVAPTLFGKIVLGHCGAVLGGFAELMREISLAKGLEVGEFKVSAGPYAADISVQQAIGLLSARYPKITIQLTIANWTAIVDDVLQGRVDLGICDISEAARNPELDTEPLRSSLFSFFCSREHPLAMRQDLIFEDVLDYPWVGPTVPARMKVALPSVDKPFGVFDSATDRFFPRILVETFSAAKSIVLAGRGISAAIPLQLKREIEEGECVLLDLDLPWLKLNYGFVSRRGRSLSPAGQAFTAIVRKIEREALTQ
jgi:DNA-binding transcriptional LysR family regulator